MFKTAKEFKRTTVTAALPYANGPSHLGHVAGAYLPADIYVRYLRSNEQEVLFICGSDEHGAAINKRAKEEGITPQEVVDKYHDLLKKAFADFNIQFDNFSRTSRPIHHETAQEFFLKFYNEGKFVQKTIEQLYDEEAQMFLADRFVKGTCPKCGHDEAYGDQCENCGSTLDPSELINPVSTISGAKPVLRETTHFYLPLDQYEDDLKEYILEGHKEWKTNVYGQCKSWLKDGLQPRSITRDLDWGVQVPVEGAEGKVLYVWFDAPIGYISSTKEWAEREGKDWRPWWQDEETRLLHFIGKDNIVFHCIIFPAILMGMGDYILPENVPANEFLNLEGRKFSTSKRWAIWLHEFIADHPKLIDAMRYTLTAIMPETSDSNFNWQDFHDFYNNSLADTFGNFVRRVQVLTGKYYDGMAPQRGPLQPVDEALLKEVQASIQGCADSLEQFRFKEALNQMMGIARAGNKYLTEQEPWKLQKSDPERVKTIISLCLHVYAAMAVVCEPFMPTVAGTLNDSLSIELPNWTGVKVDTLVPAGTQITVTDPLFPKLDASFIDNERAKLEASQSNQEAKKPMEAKDFTSFDEFQKMDIRVCTILTAEKVKKANKLLQFTVDTGLDTRTIVSGVAEHYEPEELVGKQALILLNLPPRKIRGVESQGMLLFAEDPEGKLCLVNPDAKWDNGSTVA
jgi:methionyl-tRNA synthetase